LVIDKTEAMTVIDVNTGKHVGKANLEETVTKTNVEAAEEVARQLRLRDIGGIIIIDFIDMLLEKNRQLVRDTLANALAQDKTKSQVFDIGPLGLLEVTRKRVSSGLLEAFSHTCPTCEGRGIIVTHKMRAAAASRDARSRGWPARPARHASDTIYPDPHEREDIHHVRGHQDGRQTAQ